MSKTGLVVSVLLCICVALAVGGGVGYMIGRNQTGQSTSIPTISARSTASNTTPSDLAKGVIDTVTKGDLNGVKPFYAPDNRTWQTDWQALTGALPPTDFTPCKGVTYEILERNTATSRKQVTVVFAQSCILLGDGLRGQRGSQVELYFEPVNNHWYLTGTVKSFQ